MDVICALTFECNPSARPSDVSVIRLLINNSNEIITTGPAGNFVCGKQRFGRDNNRRDERGVPGLVHFSALTRFGVIETQSL